MRPKTSGGLLWDVINNFIGLAGRPALTLFVRMFCVLQNRRCTYFCAVAFFSAQGTNQSKTVCLVAPSLAQQRDKYLDFLLCSKIKNIGRARSDLGKGLGLPGSVFKMNSMPPTGRYNPDGQPHWFYISVPMAIFTFYCCFGHQS